MYSNAYNNHDYNMATNGESVLLDRLKAVQPKVIFDVGANRGEWTRACNSRHPDATIHLFEITPETFQALTESLSDHQNLVLNGFGLCDYTGKARVNFKRNYDALSSLLDVRDIHDLEFSTLETAVDTGDRYCERSGVSHIDLLKVDVEGAEHLVLKGFSGMIANQKITTVQFEYGLANVYSRFLLKDYYDMLTPHGYLIGKIYPGGVAFSRYRPQDETLRMGNFLAVHGSRKDLIKHLACTPEFARPDR